MRGEFAADAAAELGVLRPRVKRAGGGARAAVVRERKRTDGYAIVAWIEHSREWGVFAQGENRDMLCGLRDRLEVFGLFARVVCCELCEGGDVNLYEALPDAPVSRRSDA